MKRNLKKIMAILLTAVLAVSVLAGCGSKSGGKKKVDTSFNEDGTSNLTGEITFVSVNDQTGGLDQMIAEFNKIYPKVKVNHESLPGASDDVKQSLMISLAAGDTTPDVFECDIIWVSQFAAAGWLLDVTDRVEAVADQYVAGPLSTCYFNDKAYAFPSYTDVGLLYYRSDLVDHAPETWEELVEMCDAQIGKDGIDYGYVFQMFQGEPTSCNMLEFVKQNGGSDLVDGKFSMNNSATIGALEFVESMIADGIAPEGVLTHKPADTRAIFEEGTALFMRNWTSAYALTQTEEGSKVVGKVGVAALPVGTNGTESSGTLGGWNFAVNAKTEQSEAAIAFAEFMSSYDAQKISALVRGTFPIVSAVYDDPEVLEKQPYIAAVRDAADEAAPRPQVKDYSAISTIFQEWFHKALTGTMSNEEAMEKMDEALNEALKNMK